MGVEETGLLCMRMLLCGTAVTARFPNFEDCSGKHLVEETFGGGDFAEKTLGSPSGAVDSGGKQRHWRCKEVCWVQVCARMWCELSGSQFETRFLKAAENQRHLS